MNASKSSMILRTDNYINYDMWVEGVKARIRETKKHALYVINIMTGKVTRPSGDAVTSAEKDKWLEASQGGAQIILDLLSTPLRLRAKEVADTDGDYESYTLFSKIKEWVLAESPVIERRIWRILEDYKQPSSNAGTAESIEIYTQKLSELVRRLRLFGGEISVTREMEIFLWGLDDQVWSQYRLQQLPTLRVKKTTEETTTTIRLDTEEYENLKKNIRTIANAMDLNYLKSRKMEFNTPVANFIKKDTNRNTERTHTSSNENLHQKKVIQYECDIL